MRSRSTRRSTARSIARSPQPTAGSSPSPPTRPCSSCAPCSPSAAWRRSTGHERRRDRDLARGRVRRLRGRPRAWERLAAEADGADARARMRDAAGSPCTSRGAGTRSGRSTWTPSSLGGAASRARGRAAARSDASLADVRALDARSRVRPRRSRRCRSSRCSAAERRARGAARESAAHLQAGGRLAAAIVDGMPDDLDGAAAAPAGRPRARRLDLLEPAGRRRRRRTAASSSAACARRSRRTATLSESEHTDALWLLDADTLEAEASRPGCARRPRARVPPTDGYLGSTVVVMETAVMELRLCALYPEQMNIYADRGQHPASCRRRCEWRGIGFSYAAAGPGESLRPRGARPHLHGRRPGSRPADRRRPTWCAPSARRWPRRSTTAPSLLAVCGGYQLLGHSYQLGDERIEGLGLADLETVREPGPRLIGNVEIEVDLGARPAPPGRVREPRRAHLPRRRRRRRSAG